MLVYTVEDTGPGMDEGEVDLVFEPFYQVSQTVGYKTPGTGLGLSISRQVAAMLGATIDIASEKGRGTLLTVRIPLTTPHA
jgi:signal transduction histidine kinase